MFPFTSVIPATPLNLVESPTFQPDVEETVTTAGFAAVIAETTS